MWVYKYVKYGWLMVSGMIIIMPYSEFMDAAYRIKHNALMNA